MKSIPLALIFVATIIIATLTVTTAFAAESCTSTLKDIPATCTGGTITSDTTTGCRVITCANGADLMKILACNKPDGQPAQYFEMYKQDKVGTKVSKLCIGTTCISDNGYAKSSNYPICSSATPVTTTPTPAPAPICTPTTEVKDGKDNDCDGQIDEGLTTPTTTQTTTTASNTCYAGVRSMTPTTNGVITSDTFDGCRNFVATKSGQTLNVKACDKSGYFEMYKTGGAGSDISFCLGSTCFIDKWNWMAKSTTLPVCTATTPTTTTPVTTTPTEPKCTPTTEIKDGKDNDCDGQIDEGLTTTTPITSKYPLKKDIVVTTFWVGQGPSADTGWSHNYDSAWDTWWMEHYGGFDDPNNRNGWYPAGFTPKENPFYVAIPYTDFGNAGRKADAFQVVPWSNEKTTWGYQESMIKNRWVRIIKNGKTVYAQVENSGPGPTDDHEYVFGSNPQPTTDFGWKAGIDVSPAVRDYLTLGPVDKVDWQWVEAKDVPAGPWKNIVTTRQSCWASKITECSSP